MPEFHSMSRTELSAWYIENVGYDLGEDDPAMSLEEYRKICAELYQLQNEVTD